MSEAMNDFLDLLGNESQRKYEALERVLSAADCSRVFAQPVTSGDYVVIAAAEVAGGGGFGAGMGFGSPRRQRAKDTDGPEPAETTARCDEGAGSGGGGGGGSIGRPVAAIVIGPDGVQVKPVFDVTKIGLAALTAWGTVAVMGIKMAKRRLPKRASRAAERRAQGT